jgi:hypothetical protein
MVRPPYTTAILLTALLAALPLELQARQVAIPFVTFTPGDVMVSLEPGPVLWHGPDGLLRRILAPTVTGTGEGMAFDAGGNLYVTRWCTDASCQTGNTVEKFNTLGLSLGGVGGAFNCQPHAIAFNVAGSAYIGQAGCAQTLVKTAFGSSWQAEYTVAVENYGVFWLDLGVDDCTIFYTSFGPNVKRFDACTGTQLPNLNTAPLPGGMTQDVRALPDGGVLVSSGQVIVRLDRSGAVVTTYEVPGEGALWAGIDTVGDGTFWAGNYFSSNVHKFNLATGARLAGFNTGTPANTVVGIRVVK